MRIQNKYDLDIFVDNLNLFETPGCVLMKADIWEAINNPIPTCKLEMTVPIGWIDDRSLVDGSLIKIHLKSKDYNFDESYLFRVFNIEKLTLAQEFVHVLVDGVLDFYPGYRSGNIYNSCSQTSHIFKTIADQNGLKSDIDNTNDTQLWVAGENSLYNFMTSMSQYAWADETSAMFWCFDRQKRLLYKNLTALFRNRSDKIWKFVQTSLPSVEKREFSYSTVQGSLQSGTNNIRNEGYGGSDSYFSLIDYKNVDFSAKKVVAESKILNISKELSQGLAQQFFPFDIGNFHKNYYTAYKQNKRILATYSSYLILRTEFLQAYRLGQIVSFEYTDSMDSKNKLKALSGTFMIDAIHVIITTAAIKSNIELVMQGLNGFTSVQETY